MAEKYFVDKEILDKTIKCNNNFSCLSGKNDCLCEVNKYLGNGTGVVFINPSEHKKCNYIMNYGNKYICNCPTRSALYEKHNI